MTIDIDRTAHLEAREAWRRRHEARTRMFERLGNLDEASAAGDKSPAHVPGEGARRREAAAELRELLGSFGRAV